MHGLLWLPQMLPRVLSLLCLAVGALGWINDYDQPVHFQCPDGQFLSKIDSQHDNGHEDRVWDFGCSRLPVEGTPENCQWTSESALTSVSVLPPPTPTVPAPHIPIVSLSFKSFSSISLNVGAK